MDSFDWLLEQGHLNERSGGSSHWHVYARARASMKGREGAVIIGTWLLEQGHLNERSAGSSHYWHVDARARSPQ